jgi:Lrp/AsnC family leucine-responsive transcriptional regulator
VFNMKLTEYIERIMIESRRNSKQKGAMTLQNKRQLDSVGWQLLKLLQENARLSFRQIGETIGLTAPAVAERVRRLEEAGILAGYHAQIDPVKVGLPILALVHLNTNSQQSSRFRKMVPDMLEIVECYCVTGNESYILKVAVTSVQHLEHLLFELGNFGEVRTSLVLSTQVARRIIDESMVRNHE